MQHLFYRNAMTMIMEWAQIAAHERQNLPAREAVRYWVALARAYRKQMR